MRIRTWTRKIIKFGRKKIVSNDSLDFREYSLICNYQCYFTLLYIVTTFSRNSVTVRNCDKPTDVFLGKWLAINAPFDGSAAT